MKMRIIYIVLALFFITPITQGQAPGFMGKRKIISGGLGGGVSLNVDINKSIHLAYEVATTRRRTSGILYRVNTTEDDTYGLTSKTNGYDYRYNGPKMVHDIMWRWCFINKDKGGLAPVGKYIALAAGTGISHFKMGYQDVAPIPADSVLSKIVVMPMISIGAGRRAILSESLLLNWGWEFSYRFPVKTFVEFDNAICSASMFRIYLGMSFVTK